VTDIDPRQVLDLWDRDPFRVTKGTLAAALRAAMAAQPEPDSAVIFARIRGHVRPSRPSMTDIPESFARQILELAIAESRAAEMLECLFDGGSVTVDANSGRLCLVNAAQLTTEPEWITPPEDMWQDDDDAPVGRTELEPQ